MTDQPAQDTHLTFKQLRERSGFSQEALAHKIGVTGKTISNWERGISDATMTVPQIKLLCQTLGVELSELPDNFGSER